MNQGRILTTSEAANYLGVSVQTVWRWTNEGILKAIRFPGSRRKKYYSAHELDNFYKRYEDYTPSGKVANNIKQIVNTN